MDNILIFCIVYKGKRPGIESEYCFEDGNGEWSCKTIMSMIETEVKGCGC